MSPVEIIHQLSTNRAVFEALLKNCSVSESLWKPAPEKWCLLEIVCHLYDEEREDFRARVKHTLETPNEPLRPIDPVGWVSQRKYTEKQLEIVLQQFLVEREYSINWLNGLGTVNWKNAHQHPKFGELSAELFLNNWLAHDFLHLRQIIKLKYDYLKSNSFPALDYAGNW